MVDRTGFWSTQTIKDHGERVISPFSEDRLDTASYRLRVGSEIYISPSSESQGKKLEGKKLLKQGEGCLIPPGQFAFLITEETVKVPRDCIALITLRSKQTKFRGLVNVSGFHVDAGYSGQLIFAVFNAGPAPVHVAQGDEWFAIFFAYLDRPTDKAREGNGYTRIDSQLITPIATHFYTFEGLDTKIRETEKKLVERLHVVERDHAIVRWSVALILGALISFGLYQCRNDSRTSTNSAAQNERPESNQ